MHTMLGQRGHNDLSLVPDHPLLVLTQASETVGKVQASDDRIKVGDG